MRHLGSHTISCAGEDGLSQHDKRYRNEDRSSVFGAVDPPSHSLYLELLPLRTTHCHLLRWPAVNESSAADYTA